MGSDSHTIAWIRHQLERLTPRNAHHEFEHLCRGFARIVLTPNILPATGPVSAGGDQGRDFESFHTYTLSDAASDGERFWATSDDRIAFACSLEKASRSTSAGGAVCWCSTTSRRRKQPMRAEVAATIDTWSLTAATAVCW